MSWEDVYIDRVPSDEETINAISQLFGVSPDEVILCEETNSWVEKASEFRVACVVYHMSGDFPTQLEIIPLEATLIPTNREETVGTLCEMLACQALVGWGDDINPYLWTLVRGKGDYRRVLVDSDLWDDEESPGFIVKEYLD